MKKPKPQVVERLDYHECAKYVEHKLGYDLRDTLGRFNRLQLNENYDPGIEYRDFWHFLVERCDIDNGCEIWMPEEADHPWQQEILDVFLEEFGEGPYWVAW